MGRWRRRGGCRAAGRRSRVHYRLVRPGCRLLCRGRGRRCGRTRRDRSLGGGRCLRSRRSGRGGGRSRGRRCSRKWIGPVVRRR
jgi:hypothetical protein